jgi:hypothetical protein
VEDDTMGVTYTLTPREQPPWRLDPADFAERIKARWPDARTGIHDLPGSPMAMHALVPFGGFRHELGIALDPEGWVVILDPADPDAATEFTLWYLTQLPGLDPPVHLITDDYEVSIRLRPDITANQLLAFLDPDAAQPTNGRDGDNRIPAGDG